jgi:hypothetical protein
MISTDYSVVTLESVLDDQSSDLFQEFTAYLYQSYCIENLEFWLAVQKFQLCSEHQMAIESKHIVSIYIRPNSPQEINIPCEMRQSILENYNNQNYFHSIFDEAAEAVLELMRINSFLPWIMLISAPVSPSSPSSQCSIPTTPCDTQTIWPVSPVHSNNSTTHSSKFRLNMNTSSSNSATTISSSFSFSEKWQLIKLKQSSRRSCSSIDYADYNHDKTEPLTPSESLADSFTSVSSAPTTCPRYKTMLKRVKQSLLGQHSEASPRSSITDITWSHWKK